MPYSQTLLTRREFCATLATFAAYGAFGRFTPHGGTGSYGVAILGDTHYDAEPESIYHSHYDESNKHAKVQHEEFRRNGEMWRERCPRMLASSGRAAHENKTAFLLQLGDLIQGDCDHTPTHKKMLADTIALFRAQYPADLPFLTVIGNHDFRGKGAREAYLDFAQPFMESEIAKLSPSSHTAAQYPVFSFKYGPDDWIFCDFEIRDVQPVIDAVENAAGRHVFLVTHGPFTTPDSIFFDWRLAGKHTSPGQRQKLYEALSRRRAIILSGHAHRTIFARHENKFGSFCEFTANSVWQAPELATGEAQYSSPADYGKEWLANFEGDKLERMKSALDFFRPGLEEYFFSHAAGHYRLDVAEGDVSIAFHPGDAATPAWRKSLI